MDSRRTCGGSLARAIGLGHLLALLLLLAPGAAHAEDPPFVGWTALLPGLTTEYEPSSDNDCAAGRTRCVDAVIREMQRRFDPLAQACDHDAIFSLTYLRTTEEYRRTIEDPTFFDDTHFVNHEDAVFARYYFEAYDNWGAGRHDAVPRAWAIAFSAADAARGLRRRQHRTRHQRARAARPSVRARRDRPGHAGRLQPQARSRPRRRVPQPRADELYPEIARRFDPTLDDSELPGTADNFAEFQIIPTWREIAWRNAERLVVGAHRRSASSGRR